MSSPRDSEACSELCEACEYNEHHKCSHVLHKGQPAEHWCMCQCEWERHIPKY